MTTISVPINQAESKETKVSSTVNFQTTRIEIQNFRTEPVFGITTIEAPQRLGTAASRPIGWLTRVSTLFIGSISEGLTKNETVDLERETVAYTARGGALSDYAILATL